MELERDVEKRLVQEVKRKGGRAYKFVSPGNSGVPDRIVIFPNGDLYFVELKTETGRLTANQKRQIDRIRKLGQQVRVVRGISGVDKFLSEVEGGDAR